MSPVADVVSAVNELIHLPETMVEKFVFPSPRLHRRQLHRRQHHNGPESSLSQDDGATAFSTAPAVDILETPHEFVFYIDVPGLSKSDIQVTVEDENTLVIKSNGKRKREEGEEEEEEGCKYVRLERRGSTKFVRKFRLPENSNAAAITAKCENGVLTVTVEKLPPPQKPKTVQVAIS
ncbi:hypothetical protein Sjap_011980 [Stephania japonica]|uniref:SHSP domain-containing protein n=1 Tax=Stephania japonica TaxID=461633 RepID=A0AAP0JEF8_9MAGN